MGAFTACTIMVMITKANAKNWRRWRQAASSNAVLLSLGCAIATRVGVVQFVQSSTADHPRPFGGGAGGSAAGGADAHFACRPGCEDARYHGLGGARAGE